MTASNNQMGPPTVSPSREAIPLKQITTPCHSDYCELKYSFIRNFPDRLARLNQTVTASRAIWVYFLTQNMDATDTRMINTLLSLDCYPSNAMSVPVVCMNGFDCDSC
jgi:hypothetical protein